MSLTSSAPLTGSTPAAPATAGEAFAAAVSTAQIQAFEALLAQRTGWLVIKDGRGRYVHSTAGWGRLVGRSPAELVGATDLDVLPGPLAAQLRAADDTARAHPGTLISEHAFEWAGERLVYSVLRTRCAPAWGDDGDWLCAVWLDDRANKQREAQLRTALEQLELQQRSNEGLRREMADQMLRDEASGLNSQSHFEDQLRREVDLSTREHREFAVVFIDVDPLPPEVEALGPVARVRIHEAVGRLLRSNTRAMDGSCRLRDSRFAVLLSGVGLATAHSRMEGLRRQCATQIVMVDAQEIRFTVSMGVASFPHTAQTRDELVAASEEALAQATARGGNLVALASIRLESAAER